MKTELYARLTPDERFKVAISAIGRHDVAELDRLNDTSPMRAMKSQEPGYFGRLQRLAQFAYAHSMTVQRDLLCAMTALMVLCAHEDTDHDDASIDLIEGVLRLVIPRLRASELAWDDFCRDLGLDPAEVRKGIGIAHDTYAHELLDRVTQGMDLPVDKARREAERADLVKRWNSTVIAHYAGLEASFRKGG